MTFHSRWMLRAFLAVLVISAPAAYATPPSQPWPQTASDLPADSSVRFGTLPNGMRYAIKRNATPKGAVSLRFRIGAGSLMERDNEQGIAHVLEHMAFRGSAHVPDGDMVKKLQSLGLTFGADTNAFTAATQTVYAFDVPKNDAVSVDTALTLMREIASNLTISQTALDTERNVVLAEAHLRDVPIQHLQKSDWAFLYGDRAASALMPIGKETIVAHATDKLVRGFYEAWYRPERATLIIVGDVDPGEMEAKIEALFADWTAKAPPRTAVQYAPPLHHPDPVPAVRGSRLAALSHLQLASALRRLAGHKANETRDVIRFIAPRRAEPAPGGLVARRQSALRQRLGQSRPHRHHRRHDQYRGQLSQRPAGRRARRHRNRMARGGAERRAPGRGRPGRRPVPHLLRRQCRRRRHHAVAPDRQCPAARRRRTHGVHPRRPPTSRSMRTWCGT